MLTKQDEKKMLLSDNAIAVLTKRYLKRDENGKPTESPSDLFWRVANCIASAEERFGKNQGDIENVAGQFYEMMTQNTFMPNSPTLMNAGRELGQLSACFVLPVEDSLEAIFEAIKNTALIHKSGGGTGFSFSKLRPKNDIVRTTMGVSSGPLSFMEVFNSATEAVKQGGTRRGANMAILRVDHPDILDFINCKSDLTKLNNFNISVGVTDVFMEAVIKGEKYDLVHPRTNEVVQQLDATEVFNTIVNYAWQNGEPGIVFLDRINRDNPTPQIGEIESTNPCGEVPLLPYEACNLGSINLAVMLKTDDAGNTVIDWDKLANTTKLATHFLDNVIEVNNFPLERIKDMVQANRKIGLGVMGWADMLIALNKPYNSEEGIQVAKEVIEFINYQSKVESISLAEQRGSFPNYEGSIYEGGKYLYKRYKGKSAGQVTDEMWKDLDNRIKEVGIRNATTTCIAPTGTISIISSASGGVEPLFAVTFLRNIMDGTELVEVNPQFESIAKERGFYSEDLMKKIAANGSLHNIDEVPEDIKRVFVTSHDIIPEWHVKMQAAFQDHTDNAVSKTVNFTSDATREDIAITYKLAYNLGLKGITVYRDGSRLFQPMNIEKSTKTEETTSTTSRSIEPRKRPTLTEGLTDKITTGCGALFVTINSDEEGLCEVFARMGKSGGCSASQAEAVGRLISLGLRAGIPVNHIVDQLKGIRCPSPCLSSGGFVLSCSDAIAQVLKRNIVVTEEGRESVNTTLNTDPSVVKKINTMESSRADIGMCPECPDCGSMLEFSEGCVACSHCGYSKCS
ncbi:MAG: vitamin B12-dependent ribonucleotide reductase [Vampirovibrionia bacterium]